MWFSTKKQSIVDADRALPGRDNPLVISAKHFVNGSAMKPPFEAGLETVVFGLGCFWGAEKLFWQLPGVQSTAVGYAAGHTSNPTYQEVCSGQTGHNEVVLVVYNPKQVSFDAILRAFWEGHNPTQGMRQGNDAGTQYRSGIYTYSAEQKAAAETSREAYNDVLQSKGHDAITTEIQDAPEFYYAEEYHQQYLAKNPMGYCGLGGTGIACPTGLAAEA
jgi:peptide-methionine (S)-S-oxide reductase